MTEDKIADLSGKEQLSMGLKFFDLEKVTVKEEFLRLEVLEGLDDKTIAKIIDLLLEQKVWI